MRNEKRLKHVGLLLAIGSVVLFGSASAYEAFNGPTEVVYSDPEKVAPGYLMFSAWSRLDDH